MVEAKRELPPELAKLVDAELGANGESRVTLQIPGTKGEADKPAAPANTSPNLQWTLTGKGEGTDQKPLGTPTASPQAAAPVAAKPAPAAGGQ